MASPPAWVDYVVLFVAGGVFGYALGTRPDLSGRYVRPVHRPRNYPYRPVPAPYRYAGDRARLPLDPDGYDPYGTHRGHNDAL